ncbi:hypothetical protein BJX62DRAFT_37412 [Aspergillus germanicus]
MPEYPPPSYTSSTSALSSNPLISRSAPVNNAPAMPYHKVQGQEHPAPARPAQFVCKRYHLDIIDFRRIRQNLPTGQEYFIFLVTVLGTAAAALMLVGVLKLTWRLIKYNGPLFT